MKDRLVYFNTSHKKESAEFAKKLESLGYDIYCAPSLSNYFSKNKISFIEIKEEGDYSFIKAIQNGRYNDGAFTLKKPDIIVCDFKENSSLTQELGIMNLIYSASVSQDILILIDPLDYDKVIDKLKILGDLSEDILKFYASKALNYSLYRQAKISLGLFPFSFSFDSLVLPLFKRYKLAYGENPHQKAFFYTSSDEKEQNISYLLKGESLNLNHYIDLNLLNELILSIDEPACAISKHGNLVGLAISDRLYLAFQKAIKSDLTISASGVCAFNRILDEKTALLLSENYIECVSAPDFEKEAIEVFKFKKKDIKLVKSPLFLSPAGSVEFFSINGGFVVQEKDDTDIMNKYEVVTNRKPDLEEMRILKYTALISRYSKTYSAVFFSENSTLAISGAHPSVYDAIKVLIEKAKYKKAFTKTCKLALGVNGALNFKAIKELSDFNISVIIQPGHWLEDEQCIEFCNKRNISMLFTRLRHYKH